MKRGTNTSSYEASPAAKARMRRKRWEEQQEWKKKNGPVTSRIDPSIIRKKP